MFPSNRQGKLPKPYLANRMHYWMLSIILYYCIHDDSIHSDISHGESFPVVISMVTVSIVIPMVTVSIGMIIMVIVSMVMVTIVIPIVTVFIVIISILIVSMVMG